MRRYMRLMNGEATNLVTSRLTGLASFVFVVMTSIPVATIAQDQNVIVDNDSESATKKDAEEPFTVGFMFGPAIPSTSVADIYDLAGDDGIGEAYDVAANLGYDIGFRGRFGIGQNVSLSGGVMYVSFPSNDFYAKDSTGK